MSPIRHARRPRLATAGAAVTGAVLLAAALTPTTAGAADRPTRAAAIDAAASVLADRADALGLTAAQDTEVRDVVVDADGSRHVRYDRTYRGLPVLGGDFVLHLAPDGSYRDVTRATRAGIDLPTVSRASPRPAPPASPRTCCAPPPTSVRRSSGSPPARSWWSTPCTAPRASPGAPTPPPRTPPGNPVARTVLTDAHTGARIDAWDRLESATGDGRSLYGGTVPLETTQTASGYELKDPTRGGTYTGDAGNGTDLCVLVVCVVRAPAPVVTDADNHWGTGTTADRATAAVDAQYGTNVTWDYYEDEHGRRGIAGDGKGSYNRVHYGNAYNNAFWDDRCFCMTYGDGDGTRMGPLVALDVAGHEMTHGVTSKTAGLTYSGESGGLNEATSDIFGTLVEFHAANPEDPGDWLIGEEVVRDGFGRAALRYMDEPSKDGLSADCWDASVKDLDVHHSSGVANHFAYLLAEGSGAKTLGGVAHNSPACDGSTVTGIGRAKLGKIWYRALTVHMTSSTDYAGARTATLKAAADLYGESGAEYDAVAAAWSAVGVG